MMSATTTVNFIDNSFDVSHLTEEDQPYECPVCQEHESIITSCYRNIRDIYIVHEGEKGKLHPVHRECVRPWIRDNPSCPAGCGAKIGNKLISRFDAAQHGLFEGGNAASKGAEAVSSIYVFGAFAVATCAALILFGEWATRDTLAMSGGGFGMALLAGIYGRFVGNGAGADSRIEGYAPIAATTGVLASLIPFAIRWTQEAYLLQGLAVYGFTKSAGFARTGISAGMGLATAFATHHLFQPDAWEKTLTILTGGVGTLVNGIDSNKLINIVPALAGMSASWCTYDDYGPFKAAMIGAATSGIFKSIFSKAYGDEQHAG